MRSDDDDTGAAAVFLALMLSAVLIGMCALVVDLGSLFAERRQLQNGADGGALAAAGACASSTGCTPANALSIAQQFANSNANDGASSVDLVCGSGLASCPGNQGTWDCPPLPSGALASANYVQVQTSTRTTTGSSLIPPMLAQTLLGNSGYSGSTVRACSRASWGAPALLSARLPLTISMCQWYSYTSNGSVFTPAPTPPFSSATVWPTERTIFLHGNAAAGTCNLGPSGSQLPGGFSWVDVTSGCQSIITTGGVLTSDPGRSSASGCDSVLRSLVGTIVDIPIFNIVSGSGNNATYTVAGFAPFFLTGFYIQNGQSDYAASLVDGRTLCAGGGANDSCIKGFFTKDISAPSGVIGSGGNYGTVVIQMSG